MSDSLKKHSYKVWVGILGALLFFGSGFIIAASIRVVEYRPNIIAEFGIRYNTVIGYSEEDNTVIITTYDRFFQKGTIDVFEPSTGEVVRSKSSYLR